MNGTGLHRCRTLHASAAACRSRTHLYRTCVLPPHHTPVCCHSVTCVTPRARAAFLPPPHCRIYTGAGMVLYRALNAYTPPALPSAAIRFSAARDYWPLHLLPYTCTRRQFLYEHRLRRLYTVCLCPAPTGYRPPRTRERCCACTYPSQRCMPYWSALAARWRGIF